LVVRNVDQKSKVICPSGGRHGHRGDARCAVMAGYRPGHPRHLSNELKVRQKRLVD
jgi:hypothetical protein